KFGGIVPEIASREHLKALPLALDTCLTKASLSLSEIDWFAVTHRPGLIGALLVGVSYVKALAFATGKSFSVFNHIEAHLFSPLLVTLEKQEAPPFPWTALVVSGGHTELFQVKDLLDYTWLGGTLDDAAGEAFDKIGKLVGLPYPAGPIIDKLVREKATEKDKQLPFPRAKVEGTQFSFSGLKTAVALKVQKSNLENENEKISILASAQEAILESLCEKTRQARDQQSGSTIVVTGGVACNSHLREKLSEAHFPAPRHCTDNAAMVALLAGLYEKAGKLIPAPWTATAYSTGDF
ncbi:MAG: tRNA (adenosine(37)-N6)-threonylcarbamoyltransferase complex transferase subunit TsaD, partial [Pseudomonadota bacterium]